MKMFYEIIIHEAVIRHIYIIEETQEDADRQLLKYIALGYRVEVTKVQEGSD